MAEEGRSESSSGVGGPAAEHEAHVKLADPRNLALLRKCSLLSGAGIGKESAIPASPYSACGGSLPEAMAYAAYRKRQMSRSPCEMRK